MGNHLTIEVTRLADRTLITSPRVSRGHTVTWIFKGDLAQQQLQLRDKDDPSIKFPASPQTGQISVQLFPPNGTQGTFRYVIVDETGTPIPWADGINGECIDPQDPP